MNRHFTFPFTVISHLDLNAEGAEIRMPLRGEVTKKFFLGLSSKPLTIIAEIPYRGFVANQALNVGVKIANESIECDLRRASAVVSLKVPTSISTRTDSQILVKGSHDGVAVKSKSEMTFSMQIPPVEPTNIRFSKYLHVFYEIVVIAKVGGMHRSPKLAIPITIGTVPLYGVLAGTSTSFNDTNHGTLNNYETKSSK